MSLSLALPSLLRFCTDPGHRRLQNLRKSQLQRLTNLIDRKKSVEMDLVKHAGELQEAYERTRGEMQVVLEGRMTDLRGVDGGRNAQGVDSGKGKARTAQ